MIKTVLVRGKMERKQKDRECGYCEKKITSSWKYCSNECTEKAFNRQQLEYLVAKKENETACLNYQSEMLRMEVICSREMNPIPIILDDDGKPLR